VRDGYLALAQADPNRWLVLDATQPVDHLSAAIWDRVSASLAEAVAQKVGQMV